MFAELVFHEISKMDEEVWNAFYVEATSSFLDSEVSRSRRIKNDSKPSNSSSLLHNPSRSTTVCHSQPSRGPQYSLSQGRPSQGQQYSCSQAQQSTLLDSQAHLNMLVWSPPQQLSSSSAGHAKELSSYSTLTTLSDPGATDSLIRQAYDTASQFYTFQAPDRLLNMSGTDLNVPGLAAVSTQKPRTPTEPCRDTVDQHGEGSDHSTQDGADAEGQ